jgi:hypothetical protein
MADGVSQANTLSNSLNTIVAQARVVREQQGVMPQLVDRERLAMGQGLTWREIAMQNLNDATPVSEGEEYDNPQQLAEALLTATPSEVGFELVLTDRMKKRVDKKVLGKTGGLAGASMQRTKSKDGITQLDSFSTSFGGSGTTFAEGYIESAVVTIEGNATEPGERPIYTVLHPFLKRDISAELAPIGAIAIPDGPTAALIKTGVDNGTYGGSQVFFDAVVAPDGSNDHKGGTFAKRAIVLVEGYDLYSESERLVGRRAEALYMFDEYIYIERFDTGGVEQYFNATAPTS